LLLPAVNAAREAARRTQCKNNIRQCALGIVTFTEANKSLPAGGVSSNNLSWRAYILSYIEEKGIYNVMLADDTFNKAGVTCDWKNGINNEGTKKLNLHQTKRIGTFLCPSATGPSFEQPAPNSSSLTDGRKPYTCMYLGIMGPLGSKPTSGTYNSVLTSASDGGFSLEGMFTANTKVKIRDVSDGFSKTLMLGESHSGGRHGWALGSTQTGTNRNTPPFTGWGSNPNAAGAMYMAGSKNIVHAINTFVPNPTDPTVNDIDTRNSAPMQSKHFEGAHFATGDGAVTFLNDSIDIALYKSLCTRSGGENASIP
jgi:hypothetical protein